MNCSNALYIANNITHNSQRLIFKLRDARGPRDWPTRLMFVGKPIHEIDSKNMHSEHQGNLAVYKVTAHPAKLMYAVVCIIRSIFVNAHARAQSQTLQDFLQLTSIYRGLFAHSPLLAQDVHCVLLSRHELDVEPLPLVEHALQDNLQFANIYLGS